MQRQSAGNRPALTAERTRVVRSYDGLERLIASIEAGRKPKPDWIHLQADCRLDRLDESRREGLIQKLHATTLRGFKANNVSPDAGSHRLAYWRSIARNGFQDFGSVGWMKDYDSPFVEDYDYIADYEREGIEGLDAYRIYSAVLGSNDYAVEDFLQTKLCADVTTIVEPMAGTAEFAYRGHFRFPDFNYIMFDLDQDAHDHVMERPWLPSTEKQYLVADVLDATIWERCKSLSSGKSLGFIGKQSHHLFNAKQLLRLIELATQNIDYFILEASEISLIWDLPSIEELTRPEMEDAGFQVALVDEPDGAPNAFTNQMRFRLEAWDAEEKRQLFTYPRWTTWHPPTLVALAQLLDLHVSYLHSELDEFISVDEDPDETDCHENATFMLFSQHEI